MCLGHVLATCVCVVTFAHKVFVCLLAESRTPSTYMELVGFPLCFVYHGCAIKPPLGNDCVRAHAGITIPHRCKLPGKRTVEPNLPFSRPGVDRSPEARHFFLRQDSRYSRSRFHQFTRAQRGQCPLLHTEIFAKAGSEVR